MYKVIRNYYHDMLDFLKVQAQENNNLSSFFDDIADSKKKQIVSMLGEMMVKFDIAFTNEIEYWETSEVEQNWYLTIYIIIVFIIMGILIFWLKAKLKEMKLFNASSMQKMQVALNTYIVFHVLFTVLLIFIINVVYMKKYCQGQVKLIKEEMKTYINHVFKGATAQNLGMMFLYIGYWQRNMIAKYKMIGKELRRDTSFDALVKTIGVAKTDASQSTEVMVYNSLKTSIESSLLTFYDNGAGYGAIKKMIIISNPMMMLKEARTIMEYYNMLVYKKYYHEALTNVLTKEKNESLLKSIVVAPIKTMYKNQYSDGSNYTSSEIKDAELANFSNTTFNNYYGGIAIAIGYFANFLGLLYNKTAKTEPFLYELTRENLLTLLETNINASQLTIDKSLIKSALTGILEFNNETILMLQNLFKTFYDEKYENLVAQVENVEPVDLESRIKLLIKDSPLITTLVPLFKKIYFMMIKNLRGNIWFFFEEKTIYDEMNVIFDFIKIDTTQSYAAFLRDTIYNFLIKPVHVSINVIEMSRDNLRENVTQAIVPTKINISDYQDFIINELLKEDVEQRISVDEVIEFVNTTNKLVNIKRQSENDKYDKKIAYVELSDFKSGIKDMKFTDFKDNFQLDFYIEIVDKFYANISESVNLNTANIRNLYYLKYKNYLLFKMVIIMMIVVFIVALIRYIIGISGEFKQIKFITPFRDCDMNFARYDYASRRTNWFIKLILPFFLLFFVIAMLISFQKKMEATFYFNRDIIENNTSELRNQLKGFKEMLTALTNKIPDYERMKKIGSIESITDQDKAELYTTVLKIIDKFEKCNFIVEAAKTELPFPYTEVAVNIFMLLISFGVVFYVIFSFGPLKRIVEIKELQVMKEELLITEDMLEFDARLKNMGICHNENIDDIAWGLKLIFFVFIIMFLMFYSVRIITTSSDFKFGLYNSSYYEKSECYD
jgi:hypothetical protein